jgi:hypothetical protein
MGPILAMAVIFSGLASMPCLDTLYPSSFLFETPKVHFSGFSLMLNLRRLENMVSSVLRRFHHYVVYVDNDRGFLWPKLVGLLGRVNLICKTLLHATLVGGTSVFLDRTTL